MKTLDALRLVAQVFFILLGAITIMNFLRYQDPRRRDVAWLFGALGIAFLTQALRSILGIESPWLGVIGVCAFVAQPYLLLRLGRYFSPVPVLLMRIALILMIGFWIVLVLAELKLLSQVTTFIGLLSLVIYFVIVNAYMMRIFILGALTTRGLVRQRLRFAAVGSGFLGLAIGLTLAVQLVPSQRDTWISIVFLMAIASAIAYYIGFAPPRWLRQVLQLAELQRFLLRRKQQSMDQQYPIEQNLTELCSAANLVVGGMIAAVLQRSTVDQTWALLYTSDANLTDVLTQAMHDGNLPRQIGQPKTCYIRLSTNNTGSDQQLLKAVGADTLLIAPIITSPGVWGVLMVFLKYNSLFVEDDLEILDLLTWQSAITLENYQMVTELRQQSKQLEQKITEGDQLYHQSQTALAGTTAYAERLNLLNEMSQYVNTATSEDAIFKIVGDYIRRLLNAEQFSIFLTQPDRNSLKVALSVGERNPLNVGEEIPLHGTFSGIVAATGQIKNIGDFQAQLNKFESNFIPTMNATTVNSVLIVPMKVSQRNTGVIALTSRDFNAYDTQDENLLLHIASFLGIAIENVQRNQQLEQAILLAEKASCAKSDFLATMSHELRTPLNGILGYVQILQRDRDITPKQREGLSIIDRSGEHLLTLINDILDLSKIEADRMELGQTAFALTEMLRSICELIQVRAEQKGLIFRYEQLSELPSAVLGDELRLRQVLLNLLGNAVKYTEQGGVILKVGSQEDRIRFQVEDTGTGIDADSLKTLFQPFQQARNRSNAMEGTGLGLAISHQLILLMDGRLNVKSQPGVGSTFWFDLDLPVVSEFIEAPRLEEQHIIGYKGQRRRILVVDDRADNRAVLSGMLLPLGFEIAEAANGQECLENVASFQPHAILMDLRMPGLNGLETMQQLRQRPQGNDCVIIAVSASAFDHDEQASREAGATDFLSKPFRLQRLLHLLEQYLKLEWIIEKPIPSPLATETRPLVVPPQEQLGHLFDLARQGDIQEIVDQSHKLVKQGYEVFATKLRSLAEEFKIKEIRQMIEQYQEQV